MLLGVAGHCGPLMSSIAHCLRFLSLAGAHIWLYASRGFAETVPSASAS